MPASPNTLTHLHIHLLANIANYVNLVNSLPVYNISSSSCLEPTYVPITLLIHSQSSGSPLHLSFLGTLLPASLPCHCRRHPSSSHHKTKKKPPTRYHIRLRPTRRCLEVPTTAPAPPPAPLPLARAARCTPTAAATRPAPPKPPSFPVPPWCISRPPPPTVAPRPAPRKRTPRRTKAKL